MNDIQISILALALSLDGDLNKNNRFNTTARAFIRKNLHMGMSNLTNNLKVLKEKGILYTNEHGNLAIHSSLLLADTGDDNMIISFVLKPSYTQVDDNIIQEVLQDGGFNQEL